MGNKVNLDILLQVINDTMPGLRAAEHDGQVAATNVQHAWQHALQAAGGSGSTSALSAWSGKSGALGKLFAGGGGGMDIASHFFGTGGAAGFLLGPELGTISSIIGAAGSAVTNVLGGAFRFVGGVVEGVIHGVEWIGHEVLHAAESAVKFGLGLAAGAMAAGYAVYRLVDDSAKAGAQMHLFSIETGVAVEQLSALHYAATMTGTSTEALELGLRRMARAAKAAEDAKKGVQSLADPESAETGKAYVTPGETSSSRSTCSRKPRRGSPRCATRLSRRRSRWRSSVVAEPSCCPFSSAAGLASLT